MQSLGIILTMLLEMRLEPKSLQFSLWDHTLVALLKVIRRAEVVQGRGVEGLELASFPSLWPWCLEKWFRLTDLVVEHYHRG